MRHLERAGGGRGRGEGGGGGVSEQACGGRDGEGVKGVRRV